MTTQTHARPHPLALPAGTVEYVDHGGPGESVLLLHAGVFSEWFAPMAATAELSGFRIIRVRRAGYVTDATPIIPISRKMMIGLVCRSLTTLLKRASPPSPTTWKLE